MSNKSRSITELVVYLYFQTPLNLNRRENIKRHFVFLALATTDLDLQFLHSFQKLTETLSLCLKTFGVAISFETSLFQWTRGYGTLYVWDNQIAISKYTIKWLLHLYGNILGRTRSFGRMPLASSWQSGQKNSSDPRYCHTSAVTNNIVPIYLHRSKVCNISRIAYFRIAYFRAFSRVTKDGTIFSSN